MDLSKLVHYYLIKKISSKCYMILDSYKYILLKMYINILIFVVASNAVLARFGFDVFSKIDSLIGVKVSTLIYFITGLSIVFLSTKIQTWLPFLGETVLPSSLIPETKNVGDTRIKIKMAPNTKVAFWASLPSTDEKPTVDKAYGNYSNAGVTKSNKNGYAILTFNKGTGYVVPNGKYIKPHFHYRELTNENGMIGRVRSIAYDKLK